MYLFAGYSTTFLYNTVSLHCVLHKFIAKLTLHYSYDHFPCLACNDTFSNICIAYPKICVCIVLK